MRKYLLSLPLLLFFHSLHSQHDSILRNFKFRDISFRAITIHISTNGGVNNIDYPAGETKTRHLEGNSGAGYYSIRSTDKLLQTLSANLYSGLGTGKTDHISNGYKSRNFFIGPQFRINNKWFSGRNFIELGSDALLQANNRRTTNNTPSSIGKEKWGRQSLTVTVGIGKGRLENITDMQNALWLNKALEQEGQLSRSLSLSELDELGKTITKSKNTRVLDFRKRTRYVLETIDGYLQNNGLINKTDIKYFSNLNDIVFFAFNDPRLSGTELFIRVTPGITNYDERITMQPTDTKDQTDATTKSVRFSAGINKHIPINLIHQNSFGATLQLNYFTNNYSDKEFNSGTLVNEITTEGTLKQAAIGLFYQHSVYPNTRTIISLRLDGETGYQDIADESGYFGNARLTGALDYFISFRTRFICTLWMQYQNNFYVINNYFELQPRALQLYANAGLQISL
ncbi:MAG TPA: hypothetical protein VF476_08105 [Chitinophagaceae bacterium]